MLAFDTNIALPAVETANSNCGKATAFIRSIALWDDVIVSELMLLELYGLLRNPAVPGRPLSAPDVVAACTSFREHPRWRVVGLPGQSRAFHDALWLYLADPNFPRRRVYDLRMALALQQQGVDEFATANLRDFRDLGFRRVWNPVLD